MEDGEGFERRGSKDHNFVILPKRESENESYNMVGCLVGKLWTDKSFNIYAFMNTIREIWNSRKRYGD